MTHAAQNPANDPNDDRYYYALFYQSDGGHEWKIDIAIWISDPPHVERLPHFQPDRAIERRDATGDSVDQGSSGSRDQNTA